MTQAAVSYQVEALEERVGAALVVRERGKGPADPARSAASAGLTPLLWVGDVAGGRLAMPFPDRLSSRDWWRRRSKRAAALSRRRPTLPPRGQA